MDARDAQVLEAKIMASVRQLLAARDRIGSETLATDPTLAIQQIAGNQNALKDSLRVTNTVVEELNIQRQNVAVILEDIKIKLADPKLINEVKRLEDDLVALRDRVMADDTSKRVDILDVSLTGLAPRVLHLETTIHSLKNGHVAAAPVATAAAPTASAKGDSMAIKADLRAQSSTIESLEIKMKSLESLFKGLAELNDTTKLTADYEAKIQILTKQLTDTVANQPKVDLSSLESRLAQLESKPIVVAGSGLAGIGAAGVSPTTLLANRVDAIEASMKTLTADVGVVRSGLLAVAQAGVPRGEFDPLVQVVKRLESAAASHP